MTVATQHLSSIEEVEGLIGGVVDQFLGIDYTRALQDESNNLADLHNEYFATETGPDGKGWPKNAPRTIARKGHGRVLRGIPTNRHRLSRSLSERGSGTEDSLRTIVRTATGGAMRWGTYVEYSAAHDEDRWSHGSVIPARRHVGMTVGFVDDVVERVADYVIEKLME